MGFTRGLFLWLSCGAFALATKRTLEDHQRQVSDLLDLDQLPAIATDVVEEIANLRSAVALAVVLGELTAQCFRAQGTAQFATGVIGISRGNGRAQISSFLNDIGRDGWELIQIQQIADLTLMIFKRPLRSQSETSMAKPVEQAAVEPHAGHPD